MMRWNTAQYSKTNQSRHLPNAPGCKMQIEQNRRSAAFARGLMRRVSSPVMETATSAQTQTAYNRKSLSTQWIIIDVSVKTTTIFRSFFRYMYIFLYFFLSSLMMNENITYNKHNKKAVHKNLLIEIV